MNNDTTVLSQEFKNYNSILAKLQVFGSMLDDFNNGNYVITLTTKIWYLESRKDFSKIPQSIEAEEITARQYACYITSIGFFNDRVSRSYTPVGIIPVRLTCYSPDRNIKIERTFSVIERDKEFSLELKKQ
jgi:hypothetical protein